MSFVAGAGKTLEGRYVLRDPLGQGGMGAVWRAEHVKLKNAVAIKLVAPTMAASKETLERFRREAQVAAALESPNIVRILDFGVEDDTPFIAMELLEGETLGSRIARTGSLSREATTRVAAQMARGIARAHQSHVVHCDLKPENVFLAHVDGEEVVKLLDFGVAKVPLLDPLTRSGAVLGTLQYMSPEQLEGRRGVDTRSDLYSFAVIVFECICGMPAFRADSIAELVRRICGAPLPVPSALARVPAAFDAWFARAAHRNPASRFASAREMSDALSTALGAAAPTLPASGRSLPTSPSAQSVAFGPTMAVSRHGGDERAGFRVSPDAGSRVLTLELWGPWDVPLARAFRDAQLGALEVMRGAPFVGLAFGRNHAAQSPEVQALQAETMANAAARGCVQTAFVVESALGRMMARRLSQETKLPNARFFVDEGEARAWLGDATIFARRGGDTSAGFSVLPNPHSRMMTLELWGVWDAALAAAYREEIVDAFGFMAGAPFVTLARSEKMGLQSEAVQDVHAETMAMGASRGQARAAVVLGSALSQMQARRLTKEAQMPNARFFATEDEARAWLADAEIFARRGGTERAGFSVHPNVRTRILTLEFWGMWDASVAAAFREEVMRAYDEMEGSPYYGLSRSQRYMPQRPEVQAIHKDMMGIALKRGLVRIAVVVDAALSQMQIRRMFEEAGSPAHLHFFTDEAEARAWLATTRSGGNKDAGYRISIDARTRIVEIERWGLWTAPIAAAFKNELLEVCEEMKGAPWATLSLATRHPPQSEEVQRLQGDTMAVAKKYGIVRAAMVAESALAAMMVRRLTQQAHMDVARVFTNEAEARAWLAELRLDKSV